MQRDRGLGSGFRMSSGGAVPAAAPWGVSGTGTCSATWNPSCGRLRRTARGRPQSMDSTIVTGTVDQCARHRKGSCGWAPTCSWARILLTLLSMCSRSAPEQAHSSRPTGVLNGWRTGIDRTFGRADSAAVDAARSPGSGPVSGIVGRRWQVAPVLRCAGLHLSWNSERDYDEQRNWRAPTGVVSGRPNAVQ
jgi:hypothetical protein